MLCSDLLAALQQPPVRSLLPHVIPHNVRVCRVSHADLLIPLVNLRCSPARQAQGRTGNAAQEQTVPMLQEQAAALGSVL